MKKCVIFGAGEYDGSFKEPEESFFCIAADGGLRAALKAGITPDLIVGDFDSYKNPLPEGVPVKRLPVDKDVTDADAAVKAGLELGFTEFELYGMLGGRPDHSLANISLLARLTKNGATGRVYGAGYTVAAVMNGKISFKARKSGTVSVFSWTDKSEGVNIKGLAYELENAELTSDFALGVSNRFVGRDAEISVRDGVLIIMTENE